MLALVERAFEVLDVVADLVRDDIGLGEVARRLEAARQLVEEGRVDVDRLVVGAIEGPIAAWPMPQAVWVPPV